MPTSSNQSRVPRPKVDAPMTEEELATVTVGELVPLAGLVQVVDDDPAWPGLYEREAARIRSALGDRVRLLEHVGSTSVPGLAAKPLIDVLLAVADSADEAASVPVLEAAGYVLLIREPDWFEHRMLRGSDTDVNLHVFSEGCTEIDRMLRFRDWLPHERTKREMALRSWTYTQNYAVAKSAVVREIVARAERG